MTNPVTPHDFQANSPAYRPMSVVSAAGDSLMCEGWQLFCPKGYCRWGEKVSKLLEFPVFVALRVVQDFQHQQYVLRLVHDCTEDMVSRRSSRLHTFRGYGFGV